LTERDLISWRGYWPASPTPFTVGGALDLPALKETIRLYVVWSADYPRARDPASRYQAVSGALVRTDYSGRFRSPVAQVKAVMRVLDQPGGFVRPPLLDVTDSVAKAAVERALADSGLLAELAARGGQPGQELETTCGS
jgi:dihydrodipicolinate synthase/N-acetylneuraminate lyase